MRVSSIILFFLLFENCNSQGNIIITSRYIVNPFWASSRTNYFSLERLRVEDNSENYIGNSDTTTGIKGVKMPETYRIDSSFVYEYISDEKNKINTDTIYFNEKNSGGWRFHFLSNNKLGTRMDTLGELKNRSWYKFSNLRDGPYFVYLYIDSLGKLYQFKEDLSNF